MEINQYMLQRVHLDNIRDHQIGGETDGITPEVAADLGFMASEDVVELEPIVPEPEHIAPDNDVTPPRRLTSKEQNENYKRYVAQHRKLVPKQIRGR